MRRWLIIIIAVAWASGIILESLLVFPIIWLLTSAGLLLAVGFIALVVLRRGVSARIYLLGGGIFLLAMILGMLRFIFSAPSADPYSIRRLPDKTTVTITGVILSAPELGSKDFYFPLQTRQAGASEYVMAKADGTVGVYIAPTKALTPLAVCDVVMLDGVLYHPSAASPPNIDAALIMKDVWVTGRSACVSPQPMIDAVRSRIAEGFAQTLPALAAAFLSGIVLGLKTPELRSHMALFTETGIIHLVVTSGYKVTIAAGVVAALFRRAPRWLGALGAFAGIWGYVLLSGAGPAAVRAGFMGSALLLAKVTKREYDTFNALALTVWIMTCADPHVLWDAGFQLSVSGVLGIAVLGPRFQSLFANAAARIPGGKILTEALASTLAAQIATMPVVVSVFGVVSLVSPIANMALTPLLPFFLIAGAIDAVSALLYPPLCATLALLLNLPLTLALHFTEWLSRLPGAFISLKEPVLWIVPLWFGAICALPLLWKYQDSEILLAPSKPRLPMFLRTALSVSAALTVVAASLGITLLRPLPQLQIQFLNTGTGGPAALISGSASQTALIDAGGAGSALADALSVTPAAQTHHIDAIFITDVRPGHFNGIFPLLGTYTIGAVYTPGDLRPTAEYAMLYYDLQQAGIPLRQMRQGMTYRLGAETALTALTPQTPLSDSGSNIDDTNALTLELTSTAFTLLFAGDADLLNIQNAMRFAQPLTPPVILQICRRAVSDPFEDRSQAQMLALVQPAITIISASAQTEPKNAAQAAQSLTGVSALSAAPHRSAESANVTISVNGSQWWFTDP